MTLLAALLAATPAWVWAALLMAGFVALTVLTMALARIPARRAPPPLSGGADAREQPADAEAGSAEDLDQQGKEA